MEKKSERIRIKFLCCIVANNDDASASDDGVMPFTMQFSAPWWQDLKSRLSSQCSRKKCRFVCHLARKLYKFFFNILFTFKTFLHAIFFRKKVCLAGSKNFLLVDGRIYGWLYIYFCILKNKNKWLYRLWPSIRKRFFCNQNLTKKKINQTKQHCWPLTLSIQWKLKV